jgi:hypothetical protein
MKSVGSYFHKYFLITYPARIICASQIFKRNNDSDLTKSSFFFKCHLCMVNNEEQTQMAGKFTIHNVCVLNELDSDIK